MEQDAADRLALAPMVTENTSRYQTAFTVSIEAADGVTTGVSAADRMTTIRAAISPWATPADLNRPGHVFPLVARENGVFARQGHTEGSVDLVKLANLPPFAVLCELTNEDGLFTTARFSRRIHRGYRCLAFCQGKTRTAVNARSGSLNETLSFFMPYGARRRQTA